MFTSIPSTVQLDTDELDFLNIEPLLNNPCL